MEGFFLNLWHCYNKNNPGNEAQECNRNKVLANCIKKEEIFPLTTPEIAQAQKADIKLKHCFRHNAVLDKRLEVRLVDSVRGVQGWQTDDSKATSKARSVMVSPLPAVPMTHLT
jgi:hypothetical protein